MPIPLGRNSRATRAGWVLVTSFLFRSSPPFHTPLPFHSVVRKCLLTSVSSSQLSAIDVSARRTMKGAANCDKHCELQNSVNQQELERKLRFRDIPETMPASVSKPFHSGSMIHYLCGVAVRVWLCVKELPREPLTHSEHGSSCWVQNLPHTSSGVPGSCISAGEPPDSSMPVLFQDMKSGKQTR
jgi:hypothetical protein